MQLQPFPLEELHIQYEGDRDFHPVVEALKTGEQKPDFYL
eukprot:Gb_26704 [translate_table: standard]